MTTTNRLDGTRWLFVATCSCGWRSAELSTSGLACGAGAHHRDNPGAGTDPAS